MSEAQETPITFEVPPGYQAGERLDVYLTDKLANATRTKVQRAIKDGHVTVNGREQRKPRTLVQAGQRIEARLQRPPPIEARPQDIPLNILFEDDVLLVVDKPAGMVVHPAYGHRDGTLVNALLHHVGGGTLAYEEDEAADEDDEETGLSTATAAPRFEGDVTVRPGIVHRLDKDTSGLLVVAKNDEAHAKLAAQFVRRSIRRHYIAIVWGNPDPATGTIETDLGRDHRDRRRMCVKPAGKGKHAITHYELLESFQHLAIVRFRLETGRTHQIRAHARHIGHPILGDATYGGDSIRVGPDTTKRRQFFRNLHKRMPRQALHAQTLGFTHPTTGQEVDFEADIPEDMAYVMNRLRDVAGGGGE